MAHVPENLPDGLANGQANANMTNLANIFTQLGSTLGTQQTHNAATVTALTNLRGTIVNHSGLIDGNTTSITTNKNNIAKNTEDIADVKETVEANDKSFVSYMKLANLARQKNDAVVASHTEKIGNHAAAIIGLQNGEESTVMTLELLGKKAIQQDMEVETNRVGLNQTRKRVNENTADLLVLTNRTAHGEIAQDTLQKAVKANVDESAAFYRAIGDAYHARADAITATHAPYDKKVELLKKTTVVQLDEKLTRSKRKRANRAERLKRQKMEEELKASNLKATRAMPKKLRLQEQDIWAAVVEENDKILVKRNNAALELEETLQDEALDQSTVDGVVEGDEPPVDGVEEGVSTTVNTVSHEPAVDGVVDAESTTVNADNLAHTVTPTRN